MSFDPPAVQHAQAGHAVEGGFHAARAGGFLRFLRRVQPEIHAGHQQTCQVHVVVLQVNHLDVALHALGGFMDASNDVLATLVVGVRLAGIQDLQPAAAGRDAAQALGIAEQHFRPLVGCGAAGKADGEDIRRQLPLGARGDLGQQSLLGGAMRLADFAVIDRDGVSQVEGLGAPLGNEAVEQLLKFPACPARGVHTVGDRVDQVVGEHETRHVAMAHGYAVHVTRNAQRQVGHVEIAVLAAADALECLRALLAQHRAHHVHGELVVPGRHRRVRREDAMAPDFSQRVHAVLLLVLLHQRQAEQRGMALVHVVGRTFMTAGVQHGHTAQAEHGFL